MMDKLYFWPERPQLSIVVLIIILMVFMYFAREPIQNVLRTLAQALSGGLHLIAKWSREVAEHLRKRSRELILEAGRDSQRRKIEHEFRRLEANYGQKLADYPKLHLRLNEDITDIDSDYNASAEVPPEVPGWSELVQSVANVKGVGDSTVKKMLDEIHRSAVAGEKKALQEYRAATAKRHKILSTMAPLWKDLKATLEKVGKSINELLDTTRRIDSHMERFESIQGSEDRTARALSASAVKLFVISLFVVAIAAGAAFINFQLIALPMSELVPSGTRLLGTPIATVAALVIVLMEVTAGIFLLDTLGITNLFPQLSTLATPRRRIILTISFFGLLLLASIEASLAVLREQLVEAEMTLMESLAGTGAGAVAEATGSMIPVVGQAVLGFILPWILAMIAIPLEMLIDSGRHVLGRFLVLIMLLIAAVTRFLAYVTQYLILLIAHLYDACIMIPIQIERWIRGDKAPKRIPLTAEDLTRGAAVVATQGAAAGIAGRSLSPQQERVASPPPLPGRVAEGSNDSRSLEERPTEDLSPVKRKRPARGKKRPSPGKSASDGFEGEGGDE
jgi:hypothetical protein